MRPSFGTDLTSFLGVALGAAAGAALTAALVVERSHASHHHHDVHYDGRHSISVVVGDHGKHETLTEQDVWISELVEAEVEAEKARVEGRKIRLRVEPQIRVERREREERRR